MKILGFLAALLVLTCGTLPPAYAVNNWGNTIHNETTEVATACEPTNEVRSAMPSCFDFNSSLSPASTSFTVRTASALACLKPDWNTEGVPAGTPATAVIRFAPTCDVSSAANSGIQSCAAAGCTLTGANDVPASQLACVVLGPGCYRVDFPSLPDATDVGIFTVQGGVK